MKDRNLYKKIAILSFRRDFEDLMNRAHSYYIKCAKQHLNDNKAYVKANRDTIETFDKYYNEFIKDSRPVQKSTPRQA